VIIMSLWWKRMTRNGALAGMVVGAATVLIWHQFAWFGLYEIVPGFLFGLVAIVVFSLIGEKPSEQMEKNFDFVVRTVRGA
jgi:sodium/proline symporter